MKRQYIVLNKIICDDTNFNLSYKIYETNELEKDVNYVEDIIKTNKDADKNYYVAQILNDKGYTTMALSTFIEYYEEYNKMLKELKHNKKFKGAKAAKYE